jgi:hypothetical protein
VRRLTGLFGDERLIRHLRAKGSNPGVSNPAREAQLACVMLATASIQKSIYSDVDIERFSAVYFKFKPRQKQSVQDHQLMNGALDPSISRFKELHSQDSNEAEL